MLSQCVCLEAGAVWSTDILSSIKPLSKKKNGCCIIALTRNDVFTWKRQSSVNVITANMLRRGVGGIQITAQFSQLADWFSVYQAGLRSWRIHRTRFHSFAQKKKKTASGFTRCLCLDYAAFYPARSSSPAGHFHNNGLSSAPNGILAVIMYAGVLCRLHRRCHPESHKCNYTKPLITKQCNLLPEWQYMAELHHSNYAPRGEGSARVPSASPPPRPAPSL